MRGATLISTLNCASSVWKSPSAIVSSNGAQQGRAGALTHTARG
jgi:hypothetical protein